VLKKSIALFFTMIMMISFTVGCSSVEWGVYNLSKEMGSLEKYQVTGEIGVTLDNFDSQDTYFNTEFVSPIQEVLNQYSLVFDSKIDTKASKMMITYYIKDKNNGSKEVVTSLLSDGNVIYIKANDLFEFIKNKLGEDLTQIYGDVQYISINKEEMKELLMETYNEELADLIYDVCFNLGSYTEQNRAWQNVFEGAMKEVYDKYDMGIIKKGKDKYTISLTPEIIIKTFTSLANYSIDNIDNLGSYMKKSIGSLDDSQKQLLKIYDIDLSNFENDIDKVVKEVRENKEFFKGAMDEIIVSVDNNEIIDSIKGTKMDYSLEKTKEGIYKINYNAILNINDELSKKNILKTTITMDQTIKPINDIIINISKENVIAIREFYEAAQSIEQYIDETNILSIDLDNGYYVVGFDEGVVNVKVIEGSSYLPLKEVGGLLNENISWDNDKKQPFVAMNGTNVYFNSLIINGTSYIPLRELERLGYTVDWEAKSNIVTIK